MRMHRKREIFSADLTFDPGRLAFDPKHWLVFKKPVNKVTVFAPDGRIIAEGSLESMGQLDENGCMTATLVVEEIYPKDYHAESD